MTPAETKKLYESACRSRRMDPHQEEASLWHKTLRDLDPRDVQAALDGWFASSDTDDRGQVKSRFLPAPGELRPLAEAARRKREAAAREPQEMLCWRCERGHRFTSFIARGQLAPAKRCRICDAPMSCERMAA